MKKIVLSLSLLLTVLLLGGCHEAIEHRITDLRNDIASLEQKISSINDNISSLAELISALEKNEHITKIRPYSVGDRSGYQIVFTSGNSLIIRNGADGDTPIVGVRYNENYEDYYWTIQMGESGTPTWMVNSYGLRVRATGTVPQLKIEEGIWWYTFDGSTWIKCNWGPAQGESGASMFTSIDTSDPYRVVFTLANGYSFQIPTQLAFDELTDQCDAINETMKIYSKLVSDTDSSAYVQSVTAFEEGGVTGYRIALTNGKVFSIRNGYDNRDSVLISARSYTDGKLYWAWRNRSDEDWQWMLHQGKMVCATMEDATPHIGVVDSLGQILFTVTLSGGATELMRDSAGNPVQATGRVVEDLFTGVDLSDISTVVLTLLDGRKISLPRTRAHIPSIDTSPRNDYVEAETHYTYQILLFITDTLETVNPLPDYDTYRDSSGIRIEAMAIDDGFAEAVKLVSFNARALDEGGYQYNMIIDVPFTTGPSSAWNTSLKSRIAVFISWQDKTIMKVLEFRRVIMPYGLSVSPSPASVAVGKTVQLSVTYIPTDATETNVTWSSSDTSVATVNASGLVTGVAAGECTITAHMGYASSTCKVTVTL